MIQIYIFFILFIVLSCGKKDIYENEYKVKSFKNLDDSFFTIINPLEKIHHGSLLGLARFSKFGDEVKVFVRLTNGPKSLHLYQYLLSGKRCPTVQEDIDGDGLISFHEAQKKIGKVMIALDNDLNSISSGSDLILRDEYNYFQSGSYDLMVSDLFFRQDSFSSIYKIKEREMEINQKVIGIFIGNLMTESPYDSQIMVGCGILKKTSLSQNSFDSEVWEVGSDSSVRRHRDVITQESPSQRDQSQNQNQEHDQQHQDSRGGWRERLSIFFCQFRGWLLRRGCKT